MAKKPAKRKPVDVAHVSAAGVLTTDADGFGVPAAEIAGESAVPPTEKDPAARLANWNRHWESLDQQFFSAIARPSELTIPSKLWVDALFWFWYPIAGAITIAHEYRQLQGVRTSRPYRVLFQTHNNAVTVLCKICDALRIDSTPLRIAKAKIQNLIEVCPNLWEHHTNRNLGDSASQLIQQIGSHLPLEEQGRLFEDGAKAENVLEAIRDIMLVAEAKQEDRPGPADLDPVADTEALRDALLGIEAQPALQSEKILGDESPKRPTLTGLIHPYGTPIPLEFGTLVGNEYHLHGPVIGTQKMIGATLRNDWDQKSPVALNNWFKTAISETSKKMPAIFVRDSSDGQIEAYYRSNSAFKDAKQRAVEFKNRKRVKQNKGK